MSGEGRVSFVSGSGRRPRVLAQPVFDLFLPELADRLAASGSGRFKGRSSFAGPTSRSRPRRGDQSLHNPFKICVVGRSSTEGARLFSMELKSKPSVTARGPSASHADIT